MKKLDLIILASISVTIISLYATIYDILDENVGLAVIGILIGFVIYLFSLKSSRQSLLIMMVLLDDDNRKILSCLNVELTIKEIASKTGIAESVIGNHLPFLEDENLVKSNHASKDVKYKRTF